MPRGRFITGIDVNDIRIRRFGPAQVFQWLSCGWRLLRRRPLPALRPSAAFALLALLLVNIPVVGTVLLLLLLPTILASFIVHAHLGTLPGGSTRNDSGGAPPYVRWGRELRHALFGASSKTVNLFSLAFVGIAMVLLGLVFLVLFRTIGGQSALGAPTFFELTTGQMIRVVLAYVFITPLWAVVSGMLLWSLPLLILRDLELRDALQWGLRGFVRNRGAAIVFPLLFAACLWPGLLVKLWVPVLSPLVQWLLLTVASALFGYSAYCSYRLVYAEAKPAAPAAPARPPAGQIPPGSIPGPRPRAR
jgi:hypothetical protein